MYDIVKVQHCQSGHPRTVQLDAFVGHEESASQLT